MIVIHMLCDYMKNIVRPTLINVTCEHCEIIELLELVELVEL